MFTFRLYVTGDAPNSLQGMANLQLCKTYFPTRHTIEIVDVLLDPKRALTKAILLTPIVVTTLPIPRGAHFDRIA